MYIDKGTNIDGAWTTQVAYSPNGQLWTTLSADGLAVAPVIKAGSKSATNQKSGTQYLINLYYGEESNVVLQFGLDEITNQAGWTNDLTGLFQAVTDLNTWIADLTGSITITATNEEYNATGSNIPAWFRDTAVSNTAVAVKAAAGNVYGWNIINPNGSDVYVKLYDKAAAGVIVGTDVPFKTLQIPANGSVFLEPIHDKLQYCGTAISVACTTGLDDTDATAPGTAVYVEIAYK